MFLNSDIEKFSKSLLAAKTFWANIYFWRDGGYFGGNDQLKPLLHIWSLSVEEQFYLFFPTFILICLWLKRNYKIPIITNLLLLIILSFTLWIYLNLIDGQNPAFFLLPTRAWQFGLGAFIFFLNSKNNLLNPKIQNGILILSLLLLVNSIFISNNNISQTVLVSFGVALFIFSSFNNKNSLLWIFKNNIAVSIGKVSYSVYLYHWPIAVFISYYYVDNNIKVYISTLGILLSFFIGYMSYRFIEIPFRHNYKFKFTIMLLIICSITSLSILKFIHKNDKTNSIEKWASINGTHYRCPVSSYYAYGSSRACIINQNENHVSKIALIGNSHAQMYVPLFREIFENRNYNGILIPINSCLPTVKLNLSSKCMEIAKKNLNTILKDKDITHVFIAMTWYQKTYKNIWDKEVHRDKLDEAIIDLVKQLKNSGKKVSVLSPIAIPKYNLASKLPRLLKFNKIKQSNVKNIVSIERKNFDNEFNYINYSLKKQLKNNYINVFNDLCDEDRCYFIKNDILYFADEQHLSKEHFGYFLNTRLHITKLLE